MPKKAQPKEATAPLATLVQPPSPSPLIQKLRQDWRWAGISQFLWTFSDAFGLVDWDIEALEADLDGDEASMIPELLVKLLYALTYNRFINRENVWENLRKQYSKRAPEGNVLGTIDEPVDWATLGLGQKVQIFWELCEWQLADPARFRGLLKNEDEATSWRIDPIGWDKVGNTYYLFDDNRLWVQRLPPPPPRPPKKTSQKAKRALKRSRPPVPQKTRERKPVSSPSPSITPPPKPAESEVVSGARRRTQVSFYGNPTPTVQALKRGGPSSVTPTTRGTRSSAHGKEPVVSPSKLKTESPMPLGTRVSRRLRQVEDEWQQVPPEWMAQAGSSDGKMKSSKRKRGDDDESELSDLTDEDDHLAELKANGLLNGEPASPHKSSQDSELSSLTAENEETIDSENLQKQGKEPEGTRSGSPIEADGSDGDADAEATVKEGDDLEVEISPSNIGGGLEADVVDKEADEVDDVKEAVQAAANLPEGFIEWEAVCVTLYDWRTWPEQFANSRHPDEKALYRLLRDSIAPTIIEALVIKEQERLKQEAINNRKRSSRIATRELEKEEMLRREQAQREMEERMERVRREEARVAREEADLVARERAREDRLREREDRANAREQAIMARAVAEQEAKEKAERDRQARAVRRKLGSAVNSDDEGEGPSVESAVAPRTTAGQAKEAGANDGWEINCEVCLKTGWNLEDDEDVVCCDDCGRWQHVECHNRLDAAEGRPRRNWDRVEFRCKDCRRKASKAREAQRAQQQLMQQHQQPRAPQAISHMQPSSTISDHHADPPRRTNGYGASHLPPHATSGSPHPLQYQPTYSAGYHPVMNGQTVHTNASYATSQPNGHPRIVPHAAAHPFAPPNPHQHPNMYPVSHPRTNGHPPHPQHATNGLAYGPGGPVMPTTVGPPGLPLPSGPAYSAERQHHFPQQQVRPPGHSIPPLPSHAHHHPPPQRPGQPPARPDFAPLPAPLPIGSGMPQRTAPSRPPAAQLPQSPYDPRYDPRGVQQPSAPPQYHPHSYQSGVPYAPSASPQSTGHPLPSASPIQPRSHGVPPPTSHSVPMRSQPTHAPHPPTMLPKQPDPQGIPGPLRPWDGPSHPPPSDSPTSVAVHLSSREASS